MKRKFFILSCVAFLLVMTQDNGGADTDSRGVKVRIKDSQGQEVGTYSESHALLIGVSNYSAGWPKLYSVPGEIKQVAQALDDQGFSVTQVVDPDARALKGAFETFIGKYGYSRGNRLVFFFSGHGYSRDKDGMGYLVPTDAPDPRKDASGFYRQALSMSRIMSWCREMTANHALFLFDSCFSGSVFKAKALPEYPPHISALTARPVRQFISAGDAGEEVPARSVFAPSFLKALRGEADLSGDGYVTGTELGMYLHDKVIYYGTGQTPQYGKIKDPALDEGDFVFFTGTDTTPKMTGAKEEQQLSLNGDTKPVAEVKQTARQSVPPKRTSRIYINTQPADARVRILNIKPRYNPGMELEPGVYTIEVSKGGYETLIREVTLDKGESLDVNIVLKRKKHHSRHTGMNRVAVLKLNNQANIPRPTMGILMKVVSDTLKGLLPAKHYQIMNEKDIFHLLKKRGVRLEKPCEGACVIGLGRKIGANYIVTGSIRKAGRKLIVTVKFLDTLAGNLIAQEKVVEKKIIPLRVTLKNAVTQMVKDLRLE